VPRSEADIDNVRAELTRVDWDFPGAGTARSSLHAIHWFPGNFIPQIPRFLIQLLSRPGDRVYDPFCGTGTTFIEAALLNRVGLGSDVSAIALQVAVAKRVIIDTPLDVAEGIRVAQQALLWKPLIYTQEPGANGEGSNTELESWYHPHTLDELRGIWRHAIEPARPGLRPVLEAVFTDTLFACASASGSLTRTGGTRRHHWGWVADNVKPKTTLLHDAVKVFLGKLEKLFQIISGITGECSGRCSIFRADARRLPLRPESVDLVVTSPPYMGMIDYTRAGRLSYLWYGWPMDEAERNEIGARFRRTRVDAYERYVAEIESAARATAASIRRGGFCAVLVGASRRFPEAREATTRAFASVMETIWGPTARRSTRRRVAERAGREAEETLCVYQRLE
jgi:SAM-dependent methyltransferase